MDEMTKNGRENWRNSCLSDLPALLPRSFAKVGSKSPWDGTSYSRKLSIKFSEAALAIPHHTSSEHNEIWVYEKQEGRKTVDS